MKRKDLGGNRRITAGRPYDWKFLINILNSMQDGVYIINKEYELEYINPVLEREFGLPGIRKCYEYLHDHTEVCTECRNEEVFSGKTVRWEWHSPRNQKTYDLIATPLKNPDGDVSKLEIFRDITERKKAEEVLKRDRETLEKLVEERSEELLRVQRKLEQAKRLSDIGSLAATIAHELRNPLGVIQAAVYNIRRKREKTSLDKHLNNIEKKISESSQIINNLLSYTRIKMPDCEMVNIHDILEECLSAAGKRFYGNSCFIANEFGSIKDLTIEADPFEMKEVFNNILNNAFESIPAENGEIEVAARLENGKFVAISFKDNGAGIEKDDLNRVFEPFFTRRSKGTGLGLTICSELVNLHNGRIDIESEKGRGTVVVVHIPMKRDIK